MKKSHTEQRTESVEVIDDILCNNCGNSLRGEGHGFEGLVEVKIIGGWALE